MECGSEGGRCDNPRLETYWLSGSALGSCWVGPAAAAVAPPLGTALGVCSGSSVLALWWCPNMVWGCGGLADSIDERARPPAAVPHTGDSDAHSARVGLLDRWARAHPAWRARGLGVSACGEELCWRSISDRTPAAASRSAKPHRMRTDRTEIGPAHHAPASDKNPVTSSTRASTWIDGRGRSMAFMGHAMRPLRPASAVVFSLK